jgi:hypothetical protein
MKSTIGRPRRLTGEQVARILAWHQQILALKALRASPITQRELATDLGDSTGNGCTRYCVRGQFRKPSP